MTLEQAEADPRFEQFKFCSMIELGKYIARCNIYLAKNPGDADVQEFHDAAVLINKSRAGIK